MHRRSPLTGILVLCSTLALILFSASPAAAVTVGDWRLNQLAPGVRAAPSASFAAVTGPALRASADTTIAGAQSGVMPSGGLYFRGWRNTVKSSVDMDSSMLSTDPAFEASLGTDGGSATFDPQRSNFSVSVLVRPDAASSFPLGTWSPGGVSPNIAQKGLSNATGGFWKVSLRMGGATSGTRYWYPFCTFKSGSTELKPGYSGAIYPLAANTSYQIICSKTLRSATLQVRNLSGVQLFTQTLAASVDLPIDNAYPVSVAHKPRSTDPRDCYAGTLANLSITKG